MSCGMLCLRLCKSRALRRSGWFRKSFALLVLGALSFSFTPERAGLITGALWFVFLMVPILASTLMRSATLKGAWGRALFLSRLVALLHPMDGMPGHVRLIAAMRHFDRGEIDDGRAIAADLEHSDSPLAHGAKVVMVRATGDWERFATWVEHGNTDKLLADSSVLVGYLRALGEIGRVADMVEVYRLRGDSEALRRDRTTHGVLTMQLAALTGSVELLDLLLDGPVAQLSEPAHAFWRATALQVAGRHDEAALLLTGKRETCRAILTREYDQRLADPLPTLTDSELDGSRRWLADLAEQLQHERTFAPISHRAGTPFITYTLAVAITVAFAFEVPGGSTDIANLVDLGALVVPTSETPGEWWRVLSAGFLHFGPVHLVMNLAGLLLLGSWLERTWGRARMGLTYLLCMAASLALLPLVSNPGPNEAQIVVGASGGIMGLLGALLGFLVVGRSQGPSPVVNRQLRMMLMLVVIQVLFDMSTPQVSGSAHLLGLATGVLLGLMIGKRIVVESAAPA